MGRYIVLMLLFSFALDANGQEIGDTLPPSTTFNHTLLMANSNVLANLNLIPVTTAFESAPSSVMVKQPSLLPTAFFCKLEHKFDKNSKVPMKFRLGDVDYTDAIEGKNRFDVRTFTKEQRQQN